MKDNKDIIPTEAYGDICATVVTIRWDTNTTKLPAPDGQHYLPCQQCNVVCSVPWNVVSFSCPTHDE